MGRKKKVQEDRSQEALSKQVNPSGTGEDLAVRELLSGALTGMTNMQALDLAQALQKIIRGEFSPVVEQTQREMARLRERMDKMDKAAEKYQEDQQKFIEGVLSRAEKLKLTGEAAEKLKANAAIDARKEFELARANLVHENLRFDEELKNMEKIMVVARGEPVLVRKGDMPEIVIKPEVVGIKHRRWVLQPGVPTMVPKIVAEELNRRYASKAKTEELKKVLSADKMRTMEEVDSFMNKAREEQEAAYDPNLLDTIM